MDSDACQEESSEFEDQTAYWRIAQHLGATIKIRNEEYRRHFESIQNQYIQKESECGCRIDAIKGIIFGGLSSRFWLYRKHVIYQDSHVESMDGYDFKLSKNYKTPQQVQRAPFYSWECLTLELEGRSVDLVIKDETDMMNFIKFLIMKLDMVNNVPGSGAKLRRTLNKQRKRA